MRAVLFLLLFLLRMFLLYPKAYAKTYFDFFLRSPVLNSNEKVEVEMVYDLGNVDPERFRVRPVVEKGTLSVGSLWTSMPYLNDGYRIRVSGLGRESTYIYFLVQDTAENIIYKTSKRKIWGFGIVENYFNKLNSNIFKYANDKIVE